jgi:NDP-4-keto-2,6-dideoxyhexose 3-C-methyltransferase
MIKTVTKCRICGGADLELVMSLGEQALTGVFPKSKQDLVSAGPVDLVRCASSGGCGLVQLRQSYDLSEMYGMNYGYRSGLNASMVRHLHSKVAAILALDLLKSGDLVIDIGSNDATTLKAYPQDGYRLVGIDPTGRKFLSYYPSTIQLVPDFFSAQVVREACKGAKAKVITSFSMFYDLEDPVAFAREIAGVLHQDGVWIFEQSYLPTMLRTNSFDTICQEHLEFYAFRQIEWIVREAGLKVLDVEFNDINGGSFSIRAAKQASILEPNEAGLDAIRAEERQLGLDGPAIYEQFKAQVEIEKSALLSFLADCRKAGKRVCGLGASTKGNVLLQYYGITPDLLEQIAEVNEDKFGCFTPGTNIPLVDEKQVLASNPDYLLVLPWHFRGFFEAHPAMKGRKLVFPLPRFEVIQC